VYDVFSTQVRSPKQQQQQLQSDHHQPGAKLWSFNLRFAGFIASNNCLR